MKAPCDGHCQSRSSACHSSCQRYLEWKKGHDEQMEHKRQFNQDQSRKKPDTAGYLKIKKIGMKKDAHGRRW